MSSGHRPTQVKKKPSTDALSSELESHAKEVNAYLAVYYPMRERAQKFKDVLSYIIVEWRLKDFIDSRIQSSSHPIKAIQSVTLSANNKAHIWELCEQIYQVVEDLNSVCQAALEFQKIYYLSERGVSMPLQNGLSRNSMLAMRWEAYVNAKKSNVRCFTESRARYPSLSKVDALKIWQAEDYGIAAVDGVRWRATEGGIPEIGSEALTCLRKRILKKLTSLAIGPSVVLQSGPPAYKPEVGNVLRGQLEALKAGKTPASVDHRLSCTPAEQIWIREACERYPTTDIDSKKLASLLFASQEWK